MKSLLTGIFTIAMALGAMAEVPSLINYQGKLSDKSGNPVNGTKNFTVRIFDAKEGGKEIYKEEIGSVAVKDGLYSFGFGEVGKSVVTPTEVLARADGEKQVFNYITKHKPILGNVNISGGGLSWSDNDGSSDASKFTSTINKNSGAASAIFLTNAPDAGTEVSISYDHNSDGVMGALLRGGQSWMEITVGGETLSPRERLVSVPYANRSHFADKLSNGQKIVILSENNSPSYIGYAEWDNYEFRAFQALTSGNNLTRLLYVPENTKELSLNFALRAENRGILKEIPKKEKIPWIFEAYIGEEKFKKTRELTRFTITNPPTGWQKISILNKRIKDKYTLTFNQPGANLQLISISLIGNTLH